ncbi:UNVERIFIED_CONTAM: hypothetical protein GTU68_023958 [Idotea baltica]|nr:hypothetical protein [Idotea baltica]
MISSLGSCVMPLRTAIRRPVINCHRPVSWPAVSVSTCTRCCVPFRHCETKACSKCGGAGARSSPATLPNV